MKTLAASTCLLCCVFSIVVGAAEIRPPNKDKRAQAISLKNLDVKGVALGSTSAEWQQVIGDAKFTCKPPVSSTPGITKDCHLDGEEKCYNIGTYSTCNPTVKYDTFAGREVTFSYRFHDDELWRIEVWGIMPESFDAVLETMQTKYGKANVTTSDIQNRMGAHFQDATASWIAANGVVVFTKYGAQLDDPSSLIFYSTNGWKAAEAAAQDKTKAAERDM